MFFREVGLGIAYFGKFNSGETWEKNTNGNVVEIGNTARGYLAPSVSFAFGKHFNIQQTFPGAVFLRVNANVLSDYNASLLPELSMEVGFRTSLGWGIHRGDVKTIMKKLEKLGAIKCIQKGKSGSFTRRANLYRREV